MFAPTGGELAMSWATEWVNDQSESDSKSYVDELFTKEW